ncbi:hypothetical protein SprV_0902743400 [Sparganum proliferum]
MNLISGKEDAASNYARAYFAQSHIHLPNISERLRVLIEQCDALTCFQLIYSANGGTGSGLTAAICDELSDLYAKKFKFATSVYPSPTYSEITVEPYNALLHTATTVDLCDCVVLADNEAVHRAISHNLGEESTGFSLPNRIIARLINAQFLCHRYHFMGQQRVDVTDLLTNLVPFPRVHFPIMAFAPLVRREALDLDNFTATQLLSQVYNGKCHLSSINTSNQAYISCAVLFRGAVAPCDVVEAVKAAKIGAKARFVDWCPTGFKVGVNHTPPISLPEDSPLKVHDRSLAMIAGNVGIRDAWYTTRRHFDLLFNKRAFVHWFVSEGMEEGEFMEAADVISSIIQDYEDVSRELKAGSADNSDDLTTTANHAATPTAAVVAVPPRPAPITRRVGKRGLTDRAHKSPALTKNYLLTPTSAVGARGEGTQLYQSQYCGSTLPLTSLSPSNDCRLTSSYLSGRASPMEGSPPCFNASAQASASLRYGEVRTTAYSSVLQHVQDLSDWTECDKQNILAELLRRQPRQPTSRSCDSSRRQQAPEVYLPLVSHPLVSRAEEAAPARNSPSSAFTIPVRDCFLPGGGPRTDRMEQFPPASMPVPTTRTSNRQLLLDTNCSAAMRVAPRHANETASTITTATTKTTTNSGGSFTRVRFYSPVAVTAPNKRPRPKPRRNGPAGPLVGPCGPSVGFSEMAADEDIHCSVSGGESGCRSCTSDNEIPSGILSRTSTCSIWNTPRSIHGENYSNTFRTITPLSGEVTSYTASVDDVSCTLAYASSSSSSSWFSDSDRFLGNSCTVEADDDDDDDKHRLNAPKLMFNTTTPRFQVTNSNSSAPEACGGGGGKEDATYGTLDKQFQRESFSNTSDPNYHRSSLSPHISVHEISHLLPSSSE